MRSSGSELPNFIINIIKKCNSVVLNTSNIDSNFRNGVIKFENNGGLSQKECLTYLTQNLLDCKLAIAKARVELNNKPKISKKTS